MDIDAYRRTRLQELVDKETDGNVAAFARKHHQDAVRLRQILNPNYRGGKGFKEGVARRLETDLRLPPLYFDLGIEQEVLGNHISAPAGISKNGESSGMIRESIPHTGSSIEREPRKRFDKNVASAPLDQRRIPVISYVQAGMMTEAVDPFALGDGLETILTDLDVSEQTFALIIEGTSMLPEFNEGDKVIIDPHEQPRPGDFVVAKNTEEEATFKKYRPRGTSERGEMVFELVPLNDDFPTLNSERDHLRIIGVMVEHRKYRKR